MPTRTSGLVLLAGILALSALPSAQALRVTADLQPSAPELVAIRVRLEDCAAETTTFHTVIVHFTLEGTGWRSTRSVHGCPTGTLVWDAAIPTPQDGVRLLRDAYAEVYSGVPPYSAAFEDRFPDAGTLTPLVVRGHPSLQASVVPGAGMVVLAATFLARAWATDPMRRSPFRAPSSRR